MELAELLFFEPRINGDITELAEKHNFATLCRGLITQFAEFRASK